MEKKNTFFDRLNDKFDILSKKQRLTAEYLNDNYKTAALMSIIPLSKEIGVSEATIVRFANVLGYTGFIEMMSDIKQYIKQELTTTERFKKYSDEFGDDNSIYNIISNNMDSLNRLSIDLPLSMIKAIIREIRNARRLIIIGFESTAPFAHYIKYYMSRCGKEVMLITDEVGNNFSQLNFIERDDFCISLSFPRHIKKQLEIMEYVKSKEINIYSITDSSVSPVNKISDYNTFLPMNNAMMKNASVHAALLSIIQILFAEFLKEFKTDIEKSLDKLETYNEFFDTF